MSNANNFQDNISAINGGISEFFKKSSQQLVEHYEKKLKTSTNSEERLMLSNSRHWAKISALDREVVLSALLG